MCRALHKGVVAGRTAERVSDRNEETPNVLLVHPVTLDKGLPLFANA
jgi:hypothetical protein